MKANIYICSITASVGVHVRGNRYDWNDYSVKNIPLILNDNKPASEKQYAYLKRKIIEENSIKGDISKILCRNIRFDEKKFSSQTTYDFDPLIH